jgi:LPXTG-site transpeptidase (sortase) family protein
MRRRSHGRRAGIWACAAAALLLVTACSGDDEPDYAPPVGSSSAPTAREQGVESPSSAASDGPVPAPDAGEQGEPTDRTESPSATVPPDPAPTDPAAMPSSVPATIAIPAIGVASDVMELGLQDSGLIEVPPYNLGSPAGWYVHSPTPGEAGPSVILGHRNGSEGGPGVFADLPEMAVGDSVEVARHDGSVATFTVYRTEQFNQQAFPTLEVYGNTEGPELRLITCDGLNPETGMLEDNFIVYAELDR